MKKARAACRLCAVYAVQSADNQQRVQYSYERCNWNGWWYRESWFIPMNVRCDAPIHTLTWVAIKVKGSYANDNGNDDVHVYDRQTARQFRTWCDGALYASGFLNFKWTALDTAIARVKENRKMCSVFIFASPSTALAPHKTMNEIELRNYAYIYGALVYGTRATFGFHSIFLLSFRDTRRRECRVRMRF